MIQITPNISLDENEVQLEFVRASGPGGQNVNKVSTAVQLRFDVNRSSAVTGDIRERLLKLARKRINKDGILIIDARRFRTQESNRQDALDRLAEMIRQAAQKPQIRHKTRPTLSSQLKRLETKRHRSITKNLRRDKTEDSD